MVFSHDGIKFVLIALTGARFIYQQLIRNTLLLSLKSVTFTIMYVIS